jgi:hypothetical protein
MKSRINIEAWPRLLLSRRQHSELVYNKSHVRELVAYLCMKISYSTHSSVREVKAGNDHTHPNTPKDPHIEFAQASMLRSRIQGFGQRSGTNRAYGIGVQHQSLEYPCSAPAWKTCITQQLSKIHNNRSHAICLACHTCCLHVCAGHVDYAWCCKTCRDCVIIHTHNIYNMILISAVHLLLFHMSNSLRAYAISEHPSARI